MDKIKKSFQKVKQDMSILSTEMTQLKEEISQITKILSKLVEKQEKNTFKQPVYSSTQEQENQASSTHSSTHHYTFKPLKHQNLSISTGNQGVSTDRQTDRQTNRHTPISYGSEQNNAEKELPYETPDSIENAAKILDSLDNIKKEIRLKFKRLTDQEMQVFSMLYQLDEENGYSDYKTLAETLGLTESSIRDYIGRLIKKGIPIKKTRVNNKFVQLSVAKNLKKIASLQTILQLRDI